jgi:hypothetical protein
MESVFRDSNKNPGWFSRKHQTPAAHIKSREVKFKLEKDQFLSIDDRLVERNERSSQEQIELLDKRLGVGIGAMKERNRLAKQIAIEKNGMENTSVANTLGDVQNEKKPNRGSRKARYNKRS